MSEPSSFADLLDAKIGAIELSPGDAPAATAEPAKPADAKPAFVVPPAITDALVSKEPKAAEPAAEPAKEPAAPAADDDKVYDDLFKTNAGKAFQQLKSDLKAARAAQSEVSKLKAELEQARKTSAPSPEIDQIKAELEEARRVSAELDREVALTRVEASQEYKATVGRAKAEIISEVGDLAKKHSLSEREVFAALSEADGARQDELLSALSSNMSERDRLRLYSLIDKHQAVTRQEETIRQRSKEALELIERTRQQETEKRTTAEREEYAKALDEVDSLLQNSFPFFKPIEGQDDWNKTVADMRNQARSVDVNRLDLKSRAQLVQYAVAMPMVAQMVNYYANEAAKAQAELAKLHRGAPGAGSGSAANVVSSGTEPKSFLDSIEVGLGRR